MNSQLSFLGQLAELILERSDVSDCLVIVPSQRSIGKLRKELSQRMSGPGWLPDIQTLGNVLQSHTGLTPLDPLELQAQLFLSWRKIKAKDASASDAAKSFQAFMPWGRMALRDFNEIDQHLLEAPQVFQNLCDIEGIEEWSFADEESLGAGQQSFLNQYLELGPLYEEFTTSLLQKGRGYSGLIARQATHSKAEVTYAHVFVAGMSALTPAEQGFLGKFEKKNAITWCWDADQSYVDHPMAEAGIFIRKMKSAGGAVGLPLSSRLSSSPPEMLEVACSSNVMECQYVREIVSNLTPEERGRTAVILPDGSQLSMLLSSLPQDIQSSYNVTMGLGWAETPAHDFLLLIQKITQRSQSGWHHQDIQQLLMNPFTKVLTPDAAWTADASSIIASLIARRWVWVTSKRLHELSNGPVATFFDNLASISNRTADALLSGLEAWSAGIGSSIAENPSRDPWIESGWDRVIRAITLVKTFQEKHQLLDSPAEVWSFLFASLANARIDLLGEPESGLQIMGLIESRALDYDRILLMDCNEGTLPKTALPDSFIPFDLRAQWGLPGRHEREAIYAYYTYRLLNRAKEVHLLYRAEDDAAEKSRYLLQLQRSFRPNHKDLLNMKKVHVQAPLPGKRPEIPALEWDDWGREQLKKWTGRGISPSALNTLIACQRNFFYQYLLRLNESKEMEEEMSSGTFGTIVHQVLEDGLNKLRGQPLKREDLKVLRDNIKPLLAKSVTEHFNEELTAAGENYLHLIIAEATLSKLIQAEINELGAGSERVVQSLEESLSHSFETDHPIFSEFKLHGKADRIDQDGGEIIVTDYKTGAVEQRDLNLKDNWTQKIEDGKASKALQLLIYATIALQTLGRDGRPKNDQDAALTQVKSGIRSGKNAKTGLLPLSIDGKDFVDEVDAQKMLHWLTSFLEHIHDSEDGLGHNRDSKYCTYCTILDPVPTYF